MENSYTLRFRRVTHIFIKGIFIALGTVAVFSLNYFVVEKLLIPDPCYYHNRETGILFKIFFDTPTFNGGHPFPTAVNFLVTLIVGLLTGWVIYRAGFRRFKHFLNFESKGHHAEKARETGR